MPEFGFEQKSFQNNGVRFLFVTAFLVVLTAWVIALSPDLGGFIGTPLAPELRVDFINVGQGDAILLRTPAGRTFLVDGGVNVSAAQARQTNRDLVQNYLRQQRITRLDGVVVTHPHNDHLGGINPVLRLFTVDKVWECGSKFNTETFKEFEALCTQRRIPRLTPKAGEVLDWGDELFVQVLHPDEVTQSEGFSDLNNASIVLLIRYGKVQFMLTGDIEEDAQSEVAAFGEGIRSPIIKVPHHGSDTSIHRGFLALTGPKYGVIQVGRDNPFRHPKPAMLSLYQTLGIQVYRNDYHCTVRLRIGGRAPDDFRFEVDRN
jgi:competence protein ComEC